MLLGIGAFGSISGLHLLNMPMLYQVLAHFYGYG